MFEGFIEERREANGVSLPYGTTTDLIEYFFQPTSDGRLFAPPAAELLLSGETVVAATGATVDGSGGGVTPMATALMSAPDADALAKSLPIGPDTIMTNGYNSSLIDTNLRLGVTSAVVVVDIPLATGKPSDAVADYVALVALAPARLPPDQPGVPSIIGLFGSDGGVGALTEWDKAYLAALYRIQLNRSASLQRGQLVSGIKAALQR